MQEFHVDRPSVSALMSMLDVADIESLPHPNQPGFTQSKASSSGEILQNEQEHGSSNNVSLTALIAC